LSIATESPETMPLTVIHPNAMLAYFKCGFLDNWGLGTGYWVLGTGYWGLGIGYWAGLFISWLILNHISQPAPTRKFPLLPYFFLPCPHFSVLGRVG
jgi:hypothetical protein